MIVPPRLRPGDTIGVVAPSGPFEPERLTAGLAYLKARGYRVREGASLYARERYLAGSDAARTKDLNGMFADPEVRAIFAARGGYGSARVLNSIDYEAVRRDPKLLVGFSDTTALQLGLFARTGLVTYSGVTLCADVTESGMPPATERTLWDALVSGRHPPVAGLRALKGGAAEGPLIGGCLSLIASLVGTPYLPDPTGALLFMEDVNEEPYRVDRMLNQLRMAGIFDRVAGVLFGQFAGCEPERATDGSVEAVLESLAGAIPCPAFCGLPFGHAPDRRVLPIGLPARIDTDGILRFERQVPS